MHFGAAVEGECALLPLQAKLEKERQRLRRQYLKAADEDHRAMLARKKIIEERKEYLELQEKEKVCTRPPVQHVDASCCSEVESVRV